MTASDDIRLDDQGVSNLWSDDHHGNIVDESLVRAENEDKLTPYLVNLIAAAALGGFLYGYDTGVIGVALPHVIFNGKALDSVQQEVATAACTIGSIVAAAVLGVFADKLGRKPCLFIADMFFTVGAIIMATSYSYGQLVAGRLILGVGVGGAAVICPLYIAELAPTAVRGRSIGTNAFFIPFGQVVSVAIGSGIAYVNHQWRILFALGVVPSLIQLGVMHWLPESPRVLILRGQDDKAAVVLRKMYKHASPEILDLKMKVIKAHVAATTVLETQMTFMGRLQKVWTVKAYRRSILCVCLIQVFGQFTGFNTLLYYAGNLFGLLGLKNPSVGGLIPSITNSFCLLAGMCFVDRVGRRGLLMRMGPLMIVGLTWCLVSFYFLCKPTGGFLVDGHVYDNKLVGLVIAGIVIFCVGFGSTLSHLCWYQSEYLALEIRALGSAISTTASFTANLVVAVSFLSELETLTPAGTYGFYLGLVIIGYITSYFCYPETKGLSIEEAFSLFQDGWGVKKSQQMRAAKIDAQRRLRDGGETYMPTDKDKGSTGHIEIAVECQEPVHLG